MNHTVNKKYKFDTEEDGDEFPLKRNSEVHFKFVAEDNFIRIFINGNEFTKFFHKYLNKPVTNLAIHGDLDIDRVFYSAVC